MTKDEIEIYNQLRDEEAEDRAEQDRQAQTLFQEQQSIQPDLGPVTPQQQRKPMQSILKPSTSAKKGTHKK